MNDSYQNAMTCLVAFRSQSDLTKTSNFRFADPFGKPDILPLCTNSHTLVMFLPLVYKKCVYCLL